MIYDKYAFKIYGAKLVETNYYNPEKKVVRVKFGPKVFDFHLLGDSFEIPNPMQHALMIFSTEETVSSRGLDEDDLKYRPGLKSDGTSSSIPAGGALLVNLNQSHSTTNPRSASASFNSNNAAMDILDKVRVAITVPSILPYTNKNSPEERQEAENRSFGLFMNDSTILLKSTGGSITISEDGIHLGGAIAFESTQFSKDLVADNFLSSIIPSAFPTCIASMQQLPNFEQFMKLAESARKVVDITSTSSKMITSLQSLNEVLNA